MPIISTHNYTPKLKSPNRLVPNLLEIRDVPVDIMATGEAFVGVANRPHANALIHFTFPAIFVNCTADFIPKPGTQAVTGYINNGKETFQGSSLNSRLEDRTNFRVFCHDLDDDTQGHFSEYRVKIMRSMRGAHAYANTYLLANIVKHELETNGFKLRYIK